MNIALDGCRESWSRISRRIVLVLAGCAALAGAAWAAPGALGPVAGPASSGVSVDDGVGASARLDRAGLLLLRENTYMHVKAMGAPIETLGPALDAITAGAQAGQIEMRAVDMVRESMASDELADVAEALLIGYAETVAFGQTFQGILPPDGEPVVHEFVKKKPVFGSADAVGRELGDLIDRRDIDPLLGGVCKTCPEGTTTPDFPIGAMPPAGTYAFHASSLSSPGDCNWYSFPVLPGHRYDFRTCAPGSGPLDSVLELWVPSCGSPVLACCEPAVSDDAPGCGSQSAIEWVGITGVTTIYLKVSGFASSFGSYTLAYREQVCPTCPTAFKQLTPTTTCQYVKDCFIAGAGGCLEQWYLANLVSGESYVFTTCPNTSGFICPLANASPATFDTELFLYAPGNCTLSGPVASSTGTTTCPSSPTNRATISYTASATGQYLLRIRGPFGIGSNRFGCYDLGYVQTSIPSCGNCASGPFLATLTPTAACQIQSGTVNACQDTWYLINNTALQDLEFSTCSIVGGCLGGSATFDTVIELYDASCGAPLQVNDDFCGSRSLFCTSTGPGPLSPGTYKLRVRGAGGSTGTFNLTYRTCGVACTAPSNLTLMPTSGTASSGIGTCLRTETFFVTADGTPVVTYDWSITPPSGGSAVPPAGSVPGAPSSGNPAMFVSTLQGEGTYEVEVCATNACSGTPPPCITIDYELRDVTPPVIVAPPDTTVECDSVPPPAPVMGQDNCDPDPVETFVENRIPGPCEGSYVLERTWTAIDRSGNVSAPARQVITVVDTTGPALVPAPPGVYAFCLWPPNHGLVCFARTDFDVIVTDNCTTGLLSWAFVGGTNSEEGLEPCGDGNQDPDIIVSSDGQFICFRAERCGNDPAENDGRIYGVHARATDDCGNVSPTTTVGYVLVPHDQSDTSDCIYPPDP